MQEAKKRRAIREFDDTLREVLSVPKQAMEYLRAVLKKKAPPHRGARHSRRAKGHSLFARGNRRGDLRPLSCSSRLAAGRCDTEFPGTIRTPAVKDISYTDHMTEWLRAPAHAAKYLDAALEDGDLRLWPLRLSV